MITTEGSLDLKPFVYPYKTPEASKRQTAALLWILHIQGPVVDPAGRAVALLHKRLEENDHPMSVNAVKRILNDMCIGTPGTDYPKYIARDLRPKRTFRIELAVDPKKVPFPPNPFKDRPRFKPAGLVEPEPEAPISTPAPDAPAETFSRQRQFEGAPPQQALSLDDDVPHIEPEPEPEPDLAVLDELEPDTDALIEATGDLEPYESPVSVRSNGHEDFEIPDDLAGLLDEDRPRSSTDLIAGAMSMLSEALAKSATERVELVTAGIGDHIDARLSEYRALQQRTEATDRKLRHVVAQYEQVVALVRSLHRQNKALKQQLVQRDRAGT